VGEAKALVKFIVAGGEVISDDEADADEMDAIDIGDLQVDDNASSYGSDSASMLSGIETVGDMT
jgi:hypothetical protein